MAIVTGEVEYTPSGPKKYRVVFRMVDEVISECPVDTQEEGETLILRTLRELGAIAKREGYV